MTMTHVGKLMETMRKKKVKINLFVFEYEYKSMMPEKNGGCLLNRKHFAQKQNSPKQRFAPVVVCQYKYNVACCSRKHGQLGSGDLLPCGWHLEFQSRFLLARSVIYSICQKQQASGVKRGRRNKTISPLQKRIEKP